MFMGETLKLVIDMMLQKLRAAIWNNTSKNEL